MICLSCAPDEGTARRLTGFYSLLSRESAGAGYHSSLVLVGGSDPIPDPAVRLLQEALEVATGSDGAALLAADLCDLFGAWNRRRAAGAAPTGEERLVRRPGILALASDDYSPYAEIFPAGTP